MSNREQYMIPIGSEVQVIQAAIAVARHARVDKLTSESVYRLRTDIPPHRGVELCVQSGIDKCLWTCICRSFEWMRPPQPPFFEFSVSMMTGDPDYIVFAETSIPDGRCIINKYGLTLRDQKYR